MAFGIPRGKEKLVGTTSSPQDWFLSPRPSSGLRPPSPAPAGEGRRPSPPRRGGNAHSGFGNLCGWVERATPEILWVIFRRPCRGGFYMVPYRGRCPRLISGSPPGWPGAHPDTAPDFRKANPHPDPLPCDGRGDSDWMIFVICEQVVRYPGPVVRRSGAVSGCARWRGR